MLLYDERHIAYHLYHHCYKNKVTLQVYHDSLLQLAKIISIGDLKYDANEVPDPHLATEIFKFLAQQGNAEAISMYFCD